MEFTLLKKKWNVTALAICFAAGCGASSLAARQTPPDSNGNQSANAANAPNADHARSDPADRQLMQKIRKSITSDKSLSTSAHNVKVIAQNGKITLRGPVRSEEERKAIVQKATDAAGADNVTDQLTVKTSGKSR